MNKAASLSRMLRIGPAEGTLTELKTWLQAEIDVSIQCKDTYITFRRRYFGWATKNLRLEQANTLSMHLMNASNK